MTAADIDGTLAALCADNDHATWLIHGAQEQLSGPDLEAHLLAHAQPALFVVGLAECLFLSMQLEDSVQRWRVWDRDEAEFRHVYGDDWTYEQVVAEILGHLHELVTGRKPCARCLSGNLRDGLASIHADGHDNGHTGSVAA